VISQEFLERPFGFSRKVRFKPAPTHLNLADFYFLLLAVSREVIFNFSTPCTSGGDSVVQRVESVTDTVSHVNTTEPSVNNQSSGRNALLALSIGLHHERVLIFGHRRPIVDSAHCIVVAEAELTEVEHDIKQSLRCEDRLAINFDWECGPSVGDLVHKVKRGGGGGR